MKRIRFLSLIFSIILVIISISTTAFAEEEITWTDFSKVSFELKLNSNGDSASYKLYFNNVNFNTKHNYDVTVSNVLKDTKYSETYMMIQDGAYDYIDKFLEKDGDIYISVTERNETGEKKKVLESKKLDRPSQKDLGSRITGAFFTEKDSGDLATIFFNEPHDVTADARKIKVKIGIVEDNKILNNIKNNGQSALKELLSYAKEQSGIYTATVSVGIYKEKFLSNVPLVNYGYYFIYFEAQNDEEINYYPVEDVILAQAQYFENGKKVQLTNYNDSKFAWDVKEPKPEPENKITNNTVNNTVKNTVNNSANNIIDNTIANKIIPPAGMNIYIALFLIGITIISMVIYIRYIRLKDVK